MNIYGFAKTTLLDYPGHLASTLFTGNCNFRCPFCHNGDLVLDYKNMQLISEEEIFNYLNKRKGILEGICITGGEPTLQPDLLEFLKKLKTYNVNIKLDTNGYNPQVLEKAIHLDLVDYIAMDIKNTKDKYNITTGIDVDINKIQQSIDFITTCGIPYEFRTTILKNFHTEDDMLQIGNWLAGSTNYYLQKYIENTKQIQNGLLELDDETLKKFVDIVKPFFKYVGLRGIE